MNLPGKHPALNGDDKVDVKDIMQEVAIDKIVAEVTKRILEGMK